MSAKVFLIGFGPGDPDLMTIKAHKTLLKTDIIFYDDLVDKAFLESLNCEKVYVGKRKGQHYKTQDEINELLYQATKTYSQIARVKGGDPFIFGRGGEELAYLTERGVEVEIVPGITSSMAAAASAQIPLTMRKTARKLTFQSAHHVDTDVMNFPKEGTLVLYMGATKISYLKNQLLKEGFEPGIKVALVHNASSPDEKVDIQTIETMDQCPLPSPLSIIIGKVVNEFRA